MDMGMETNSALKVGDKAQVIKGCKARELDKGITCKIIGIAELGADYSHAVKVTFMPLNGFLAGSPFSMCARHVNRLADHAVNLNDGNPSDTIQIRRR